MAAPTGFLGKFGDVIGAFLRPPTKTGSPEDPNAARPTASGMLSRSGDVSFIPDAWLDMIASNTDTVLEREGGTGLKLYDTLLDDDVAMSNLQQRRLAITEKDWEVSPGDEDDPRSVKAADDLRAMLKAIGWDRVTGLMHFGIWYGYAIAEGIYTTKVHDGRTIIWLDDIVVPDRRWFGFTLEGELRMITAYGTLGGEKLPPNKFWALRTGASHDFAFYGLGLAHWCYWPIFFKRSALKFWAIYLEKLGMPTALGGFKDGADTADKATLLDALIAIGQDRAVIVPEELVEKIKLMEATRTGSGASSYDDFVTEQNEALMRIVLGQPGTSKATPQGIGGKQAEVHEGVKDSLVKADSDLICEGFNNTFAKWLTWWNHGQDVAPPKVYRQLEEGDDLDTLAERDGKLNALGWQRTDQSFTETYGDGYERKPEPEPDPALLGGNGGPPMAANDDAKAIAKAKLRKRAAEFGVDDVAPLYISRRLINAPKLIAWAKKNGFSTTVPASEMHVTQLYSRTPVDWFGLPDNWYGGDGRITVQPGGPRKVEKLGDEGAVVLRFKSADLQWRHEQLREHGASHDYPEYMPHVTFTYDPGTVDLDAIEPYDGELVFGPEDFEEIREEGFDPALLSFSASERDAIDRLVASMVEDESAVFSAMATELQTNLQGVSTIEGARVAILEAFERMPIEKLAQMTALPMLAARATARAGEEEALTP